MRLLSITAKNYRTLQDIHLPFSRSYCTISGKNNAGKSSVIRLLSILLGETERFPWINRDMSLDFKEDRTQWTTGNHPIEIVYKLELTKSDDPALISYIEKMATIQSSPEANEIELRYLVSDANEMRVSAVFNSATVDDNAAKEINRKIRDSNLLFCTTRLNSRNFISVGEGNGRSTISSGRTRMKKSSTKLLRILTVGYVN